MAFNIRPTIQPFYKNRCCVPLFLIEQCFQRTYQKLFRINLRSGSFFIKWKQSKTRKNQKMTLMLLGNMYMVNCNLLLTSIGVPDIWALVKHRIMWKMHWLAPIGIGRWSFQCCFDYVRMKKKKIQTTITEFYQEVSREITTESIYFLGLQLKRECPSAEIWYGNK